MTATALRLAEPPPADDLQSRATAAAAGLQDLADQASKAREAADAIAADFKKNPTPELAAQSMAAAQIAKNREEFAEGYGRDVAKILRDAALERASRELAELRTQLRASPVEPSRERLADLIANFRRDLRATVAELYRAVGERNKLLRHAGELAERTGSPERFGVVNIDELMRELGSGNGAQYGDSEFVSISLSNQTGNPRLERLRFELSILVGDVK